MGIEPATFRLVAQCLNQLTDPPRGPAFLLPFLQLRKFEVEYCLYMLTEVQFSDAKEGTSYEVVYVAVNALNVQV
jgi:hypothetical protein